MGPMDAWQNDRTREVNLLKPPRGGGSLVGDLCLVWAQGEDPGDAMEVFQKDPVAATHFRERVLAMMKSNERTAALLPKDEREHEPPEIKMLSGYMIYVNGPAITNLNSKPIRYMRLDEPWLYKYGTIVEADARLGDYKKLELSKLLCISQAGPPSGPLDEHEWYHHYMRGEMNEWAVECRVCGGVQQLQFFGKRLDGSNWGVIWDKHKRENGDWNVGRAAPTARFECFHKGCASIDENKTRSDWNRTGRYILIGEANQKTRNFHYEALVDTKMADLAGLFLESENAFRRGIVQPKLQFYQKPLARFMDEQMLLRVSQNFARIMYDLKSEWAEEVRRFMTIDRQEEDTYWWTVRAWSKDGKSRRLAFGKAFGTGELEKIRDSHKVQPNHTFIDSAFQPKGDKGVYAACCEYGWIAVVGDDATEFVHTFRRNGKVFHVARSYSEPAKGDPESGRAFAGRRFAVVIRFSKPVMNGRVQNQISNGLWEEPSGLDGEMEQQYVEQMAGRIRKETYDPKTGKTKIWWWESKNDHARDLANMQVLGATLSDILPDTLDSMGEKAQS
jgi:hypothetical protein